MKKEQDFIKKKKIKQETVGKLKKKIKCCPKTKM